jgi:hypothetical protein
MLTDPYRDRASLRRTQRKIDTPLPVTHMAANTTITLSTAGLLASFTIPGPNHSDRKATIVNRAARLAAMVPSNFRLG